MEIRGSKRSDPTAQIMQTVESNKKELTEDFINLWFQESQDWLMEAAQRRSQIGKSHGVKGRSSNGLHAIAKSAVPPSWNFEKRWWEFSYPHYGAVFQEFGAQPHEIRAKEAEALAFGWPDSPEKVKEEFADTKGDLVFFKSVNHPGIPAIGFVRYGRQRAMEAMEKSGVDTSVFGVKEEEGL